MTAADLTRPELYLLACALGGLGLSLLGLRGGRVLLVLTALGVAIIGVVPLGDYALEPLENHCSSRQPDHADGIVMLGGTFERELMLQRQKIAIGGAAERLTEFIELARRFADAKLAFAGGVSSLSASPDAGIRDGDAWFERYGIERGRVVYEERSTNTFENALFSKELAQPAPGETWLLITSAAHMPRAVAVFAAQGWPVTPVPVDYRTAHAFPGWLHLDMVRNLDHLRIAIHEWVGLLWYRLAGRTEQLLPGRCR